MLYLPKWFHFVELSFHIHQVLIQDKQKLHLHLINLLIVSNLVLAMVNDSKPLLFHSYYQEHECEHLTNSLSE